MYTDYFRIIYLMNTSQTSNQVLLQEVLKQRRAWLESAMALDTTLIKGTETRFVLEVIERAQKLRLELAEDRYFSGLGA